MITGLKLNFQGKPYPNIIIDFCDDRDLCDKHELSQTDKQDFIPFKRYQKVRTKT